jgi:hypothetical protein
MMFSQSSVALVRRLNVNVIRVLVLGDRRACYPIDSLLYHPLSSQLFVYFDNKYIWSDYLDEDVSVLFSYNLNEENEVIAMESYTDSITSSKACNILKAYTAIASEIMSIDKKEYKSRIEALISSPLSKAVIKQKLAFAFKTFSSSDFNKSGANPLHLAVWSRDATLLTQLLHDRVDLIDKTDDAGNTGLQSQLDTT